MEQSEQLLTLVFIDKVKDVAQTTLAKECIAYGFPTPKLSGAIVKHVLQAAIDESWKPKRSEA